MGYLAVMSTHYLTALFSPQKIALFGASDRQNSVGGVVFRNLLSSGYQGQIYAINPKHETVQGKIAFKSLDEIGTAVDLAVVATPASTIPGIVEACGEHGIKMMLILSAGFRETGEAGRRLEDHVTNLAKRYGIRMMGPNCLGIIRPDKNLNITFGHTDTRPGNVAFVSQSGAICSAILDWAEKNDIGFSAVVSTGISADLDFGDYLDYLASDPLTRSILLYIEGIKDARRFMSSLRTAARIKPVIALKVGRHKAGAEASMSHTGALVGSDETFSAALSRSGVLRVESISQLFAAAKVLSSRYCRETSERLVIITNGGGPGVMAADRATDRGITLSSLSPETITALNAVLPEVWSHANPVDIIGDAPPARYRQALDICLADPGVDGAIVILTPQAMTEPTLVAEELIKSAGISKKPILTSWMGGRQVEAARQVFKKAGIPDFRMLEIAVDAFSFIGTYNRNQRLLLQTPAKLTSGQEPPDIEGARLIIEGVLTEHRKILTAPESLAVLKAFRIPGVTAEEMYRNPNGRELMIGIIRDPVFGPVISFGSGGTNVEIMADSAISLPPLNRRLAQDLIGRTRVAKMLAAFRHMPAVNMQLLIDILVRVSNMACELPWIQEMDINPLMMDENGAVAVDARIRVDDPKPSTHPYYHLAIHPYPAHLVTPVQLDDGTDIIIRPIRPEDAEIEQQFVRDLSSESKYFRFMNSMQELSLEMLVRFTQIDYHNEMALVAVKPNGDSEEELGVARYVINLDNKSCEFALVVSDRWQKKGIARLLMQKLVEVARNRGLETMQGQVLANNARMLALMIALNFQISNDPDDMGIKLAEIRLN